MNINWPEVLIGGTIFFVLGALFALFGQRPLEARLEKRRTLKRQARAHESDRLAAITSIASADSRAYDSYYRDITCKLRSDVTRAVVLTGIGLTVQSLPLFYEASALFFAGALVQIVPAVRRGRELADVAAAVRANVLDPALATGAAGGLAQS